MAWLQRKADVLGYQNIMTGLEHPVVINKKVLNQYLTDLFTTNVLTNHIGRAVEVDGLHGKKTIRPGERSVSDEELKDFNIAVEDKYATLPGTEELNNPFTRKDF